VNLLDHTVSRREIFTSFDDINVTGTKIIFLISFSLLPSQVSSPVSAPSPSHTIIHKHLYNINCRLLPVRGASDTEIY